MSGQRARVPSGHAEVVSLGAAKLIPATAPGNHPRLLLDADALARLTNSARRKTDAWNAVLSRADEAIAAPIKSGYQGFEWADAVAN
ncbi:MAG TPA: hypothetical protein VKU41_27340, partial [Polyangiaceae bacterium]|nr:hypothetical protein [Polyangiaceae bacterium]